MHWTSQQLRRWHRWCAIWDATIVALLAIGIVGAAVDIIVTGHW